jgi:hypothetical protein
MKYGKRDGKQRYKCLNPDHPKDKKVYFEEGKDSRSYSRYSVQGDNDIHISYVTDHVPTTEEVAGQYKVDLNEWEVKDFEVTDWQMGRKDKQVDIVWNKGVMDGNSHDSGQINRVWLHRINVRFVRRTFEIRARLAIKDIIEESRAFRSDTSWITLQYPNKDRGLLHEIDIPDLHFGRLAWDKETGEDYDVTIARDAVRTVLSKLIERSSHLPIDKILLPIGNDFFNVNSKMNTTVRGTPQQEDTRWQKTYVLGRKLAQEMIETCLQIAPVDVLIIPGNHDEEKVFYMGDALQLKYEDHPHVHVDNSPKSRKYYSYGKCLVQFAHGYSEKLYKLPAIMANEAPQEWAASIAGNREIHSGDKHHKLSFDESEDLGVTIRILRALTAVDAWTFNGGFIGAVRAAESFVWDKEEGVIAQFTARP